MGRGGTTLDGLRGSSRIAVGSMPWLDPEAATQAQLRAFPDVPSWAQLPKRSPMERMDRQGLGGLPGISWNKSGEPLFHLPPKALSESLEKLRQENQENQLDRAAFSRDEAAGFFAFIKEAQRPFFKGALALKGQFSGPVTLGACLKNEKGEPLLSSGKGMDLLAEYILMHCRWQARELSRLGRPVILFLDEPYLGGRFHPEAYGLKWPTIRSWFSRILEGLQEEGHLTGIHCCGEGPWDRILETPTEFFHFDAFRHLKRALEEPKAFVEFFRKGGMVVWGLVPTVMTRGFFPDPAELFHRWEDAVEALVKEGLSREKLLRQSHFSTSCGLGESSISVAGEAAQCLSSFVSLWKTHLG